MELQKNMIVYKINKDLLYSNLTSGYTPEEDEITISKRYLHPDVHGSIIYNSQDTEAT